MRWRRRRHGRGVTPGDALWIHLPGGARPVGWTYLGDAHWSRVSTVAAPSAFEATWLEGGHHPEEPTAWGSVWPGFAHQHDSILVRA